jgi:hypothetical protein
MLEGSHRSGPPGKTHDPVNIDFHNSTSSRVTNIHLERLALCTGEAGDFEDHEHGIRFIFHAGALVLTETTEMRVCALVPAIWTSGNAKAVTF